MPTDDLQASTPIATKVEWITKEEAARLLDKSERTVLAMAAEGKIRSKLERDAEKRGQKVTLLHAVDVAALCDPDVKAEAVQPRRVAIKRADLQPSAANAVPCAPWQFMTLDQAAEHVLAPRSVIEDLIQTEVLPAVDARGKVKGGWLILRRDLEDLKLR